MASKLRVVTPDDAPPVRKKHTVTSAAAEGDRLDLLIATRDRVAQAVEHADTPARDLAALTRRLIDIAKDIETLRAAAAREETSDGGEADDEAFDAAAI